MKKVLIFFLALTLLISLAACGSANNDTSAPEETAAHTHSYTAKVTAEAACDTDGSQTYTCSCGDTYTEKIAATGHTWGEWYPVTIPTCVATGIDERECAVCHIKETNTVDAKGHAWSEWVVITAPTCTSSGVVQRYCNNCRNKTLFYR